jgi:folate-binding protein YgfZ
MSLNDRRESNPQTMPESGHFTLLPERGVLEVAGPDATLFLNGLVSNDAAKAGPNQVVYAALLTAQGRYLHDFFIYRLGKPVSDALLLDCERSRLGDLQARLERYRLRAKATLSDQSAHWTVAAVFGPNVAAKLELEPQPGRARLFGGGMVCIDPRRAELGARALLANPGTAATPPAALLQGAGFAPAPWEDYDRLRLELGAPDGSRDLEPEKALPAESNLDFLNGVDFAKGCYVGQELTARMKYRALVKKRLLPVRIAGPAPAPGSPVTFQGKVIGEMRSARDAIGLALLRLDEADKAASQGAELLAGDARLTPIKPQWHDTP